MSPVVADILNQSEARLAGVDSPRLSAEVLVAHALGCSRLSLVVDRSRELTSQELEVIESLVGRREQGEPVAYILGEKEFYGLDFSVTPDVLIPRPETEHIVEEVERLYPRDKALCFADLGTGSGILAITLAVLFPNAHGVAVDISSAALAVARENAKRHGVADRVEFRQGDFTTELFSAESLDLVVTNPPYVTEDEFEAASHEVTRFEPTGALVSGPDGLDHIRAMMTAIERCLKHDGLMLLEMGCGQGDGVVKIIKEQCSALGPVKVLKDLASHDRVVFARKL